MCMLRLRKWPDREHNSFSKIPKKIADILPRSVLYWCVVRAAVMAEPYEYPAEKTAIEMLEAIEK